MATYSDAPWLAQYRPGTPVTIEPPDATMIDVIDRTVTALPEAVALYYFDHVITYAELDAAANGFAAMLVDAGIAAGDRVALYLQNDPSFVIGLIGTWRAGGVAVTVNPMNKHRELTELLADSGSRVLLCLDSLYETVVSEIVSEEHDLALELIVVTGQDDFRTARPVASSASAEARPPRLIDVIASSDGRCLPRYRPDPADAAVLVYTSGTTGKPKAAVNTHAGLAYNSHTYCVWLDLTTQDVILGVAPLFHITGLVGHVCVALAAGAAVSSIFSIFLHGFSWFYLPYKWYQSALILFPT